MKHRLTLTWTKTLLTLTVLSLPWVAQSAEPKHMLVVTATKGFRHSSIPTAERILAELGKESGVFDVDYVRGGPDGRDAADLKEKMNADALKKYDGVIFANTTGDLEIPDKEAFLAWIKTGKAFVGMHSCSDTYPHFPPYIEMLGGEFLTHQAQAQVECLNMDPSSPATKHLGPTFNVFDEIYILKNFHRGKVHGLLTLDKHPNSRLPGDYAIAWCKEYGQGRVFYTSLGHREDVWDADPNLKDRRNPVEVSKAYQAHILGGIKWALGIERGDAKPQSTRLALSPNEVQAGFRPLFNGEDLTGWHLRHAEGTASWSAQNGMLVNTIPKDGHGTDLVTDEKFQNFTARYEFMVPKGSNSGFYLRGRHEIQILDDYDAGQTGPGGNGSFYNHTTASKFVSRKPGEWQTTEVTLIGNKASVTLNGVKIHDNVVLDRATGGELDGNVGAPGSFFLQGDHGAIAFRNMRVKPLP
jgi:type 1 glutamine amidotransferase